MADELPHLALSESLLASYRTRFTKLKELGDGALAQLGPADWHRVPDQGENSIAIIVQHLHGNMRSRWTDFLSTDGEKPDRHRDREFEARPDSTPADVMALWETGWSILLDTLNGLRPDDLMKTVTIRSQPLAVFDAINRQLAHYGYHVGQLVYLARMYRGATWQSLSIARGASDLYQARPND